MIHEIIIFILIYTFLGLVWTDFMKFLIEKSGLVVDWDNPKKMANVLLWPISFIAFIYGIVVKIIEMTKK